MNTLMRKFANIKEPLNWTMMIAHNDHHQLSSIPPMGNIQNLYNSGQTLLSDHFIMTPHQYK